MKKFILSTATVLLAACSQAAPTDDSTEMPGAADRTHADWVAYHNNSASGEDYSCQTDIPDTLAAGAVRNYEMADGHTVVQVLCGVHAYQNSYVLFDVYQQDGQEMIDQIALDIFTTPEERITRRITIEPSYFPATNVLTTLEKGRGVGDCGASGTYTWNTETHQFDLTSYQLKTDCDGETGEWPVVFSAE